MNHAPATFEPSTLPTPQAGALVLAPRSALGEHRKTLKAWHVDCGVTKTCVMIAPIIVTEINRVGGFVKWRVPNQHLDIERIAAFEDVHSTLGRALAHAARLLKQLAEDVPNELQR